MSTAEQCPSSHPNCWPHVLLPWDWQQHPGLGARCRQAISNESLYHLLLGDTGQHATELPLRFLRLLIKLLQTDREMKAGIKEAFSKPQGCTLPLSG